MDQATKAGLLDLLEQACGQGWSGAGGLPGAGGQRAATGGWAAVSLANWPTGWQPDARPAGLGGRRDRAAVRRVGEVDRSSRKLAAATRLSGAGVGVAGQCAPGAGGAARPSVATVAPAGPDGAQAVPRTGWSIGQGRSGSSTRPTSAGWLRPWSRTWSVASSWPRSSRSRTPPKSRSCSVTRWSARGCWSWSVPARTGWSTSPWTNRPGRSCLP